MTVPGTAAEALAGLARPRPAGWLASPMPEDLDVLLGMARQALEADHPGVDGRIHLVSARYTAAVFTVGRQHGSVILKLHADPMAYAGESLAYALFTGTAPVAELYSESEASRSLVLEYLPKPAEWAAAGMPSVLVDRVAEVHTASLRLPPQVVQDLGEFTLGRQLVAAPPPWIRDAAAWNDVVAAHHDAYGAHLVPLGHLDLKPEHLRERADGSVALLDVETVRPDVTGLVDLVTLPAVLRQVGHELRPAEVLDLYLGSTTACGGAWTPGTLRAALRAYATATGLESLHGLGH